MTLTPEDRTRYLGYLNEAEEALHRLSLGGMARVYVDQNGERVEFTASNTARLRAYVLELKVKLGQETGVIGPARVFL